MEIAVLSTLISSIALIGVAIGLLLQARQLRVNQLQASYFAQLELIKLAMDRPELSVEVEGINDPEIAAKGTYINWHFTYLKMSYEIKTISDQALRSTLKMLFANRASRTWWEYAMPFYQVGADSRRTKAYVAIVNEEFQLACLTGESAKTGSLPPRASTGSPDQVLPP